MFTTKPTSVTFGPTLPGLTMICSSSPSPSPVRLSPVCVMPCCLDSSRPKKTASRSLPCASMSTALTSRSTSPSSTSQPRPTTMRPRSAGKPSTPPFSMANTTFCLCGAPGMKPRITWQSVGRMSMKCWPPSAGKSTMRSLHPSGPRNIAATTSTERSLLSISNVATSASSEPSRMWTMPFFTSRNFPPVYAATTKINTSTIAGNFFTFTHTISFKLL
mmetsp:Transcript_49740/g.142787  ORF Transcript_49740/g.142787 Transcript_49740/m.142787 type:complete len:218 (+) Transcript_49740:408-1061(+)